jgi:hypothetical protein
MVDKTIRFGVEAGDLSRIRALIDKGNKDDINAAREELDIVKKKNKEAEEAERDFHRRRRQSIETQKAELELWRHKRQEEASRIGRQDVPQFNRETRRQEAERRRDIAQDKIDFINEKKEFEEQRRNSKKQIQKLDELIDTSKQEGSKGRQSTENALKGANIASGLATGNIQGVLRSLGPAGMMAGILGGTIWGAVRNSESGLQKFGMMQGTSPYLSSVMAMNLGSDMDLTKIGLKRKEFFEKYIFPYSTALGKDITWETGGLDLSKQLYSASRSRNLGDGQIEGLLSIQRYSGRSGLGTISVFEDYLKASGRSLIQLPEILQTYISTANSILNRTGGVDPRALEQTLTSIGQSYNVEGVNLDRMTRGIEGMGSISGNPLMLSIQQQVLRGLYPKKSQWEMMSIMENPLQHPEYIQALMKRMTTFGGGADYSKFMMLSMLEPYGMKSTDIEKMFTKGFVPSDIKKSTNKGDQYIRQAEMQTGSTTEVVAKLGNVVDLLSNWITVVVKDPSFGLAIESAISRSIDKNKHTFQGR